MEPVIIIGLLLFLIIFTVFIIFTGKNNKRSIYKNTSQLSDIQKGFLENQGKRIVCRGNEIHISNHHHYSGISNTEVEILTLQNSVPEIKIFENNELIKTFKIEPKIPIRILTDKYLNAKFGLTKISLFRLKEQSIKIWNIYFIKKM